MNELNPQGSPPFLNRPMPGKAESSEVSSGYPGRHQTFFIQDLFNLSPKVAVVTGASSGIGRAMAFHLAKAGAKVVLVARRLDRLKDAVHAISLFGGDAVALSADLDGDCREIAGRMAEPFGSPDILVNGAGVNLRQPIHEIDLESWDRTLNLNLRSPFFLAREFVGGMKEKGWGRIINIASLQSARAFPDSVPYGASKGGICQLTRAMAEAWSKDGITCNSIAPGFFPTELTAKVFGDEGRAQSLAAQTAIGRNGTLDDFAGLSVFLASKASDYVTGQTIYLDGGFTAK